MTTPPPLPPNISPSPTITYQLTRWDIFASWMLVPLRNRMVQIFIVVGFIFNSLIFVLPDTGKHSLSYLALKGLAWCIFSIFTMIFIFALGGLAMAFLAKQNGIIGKHTLVITGQGLIERTEFNDTLHKWPAVCRILSLFGYYFIYVSDQNSHQVPRRCFPPHELDRFMIDLRARAINLG